MSAKLDKAKEIMQSHDAVAFFFVLIYSHSKSRQRINKDVIMLIDGNARSLWFQNQWQG